MKKGKQIYSYSYGDIILFTIKLKGLVDFHCSQVKRALHILVTNNEFLKALGHLSVTPPTATYPQVPLIIQTYELNFPDN